jgi:hypothetical protein
MLFQSLSAESGWAKNWTRFKSTARDLAVYGTSSTFEHRTVSIPERSNRVSVILKARRLAHDHAEQERVATAVKAWLAQIEKKRAATADSVKTAPHEPFAPERLAA